MSECLVDGCGRPVSDADVCSDCGDRLEKALGNVRWLLHELDLVITRQTAKAEHVGGASREQPLVFSAEASDLRWALVNTVTTWARLVAEEKPATLPRGDAGLAAAWLTGHVEWLRHHRAANEAVEEITSVIRRCLRAIDVAPARLYAGPCSIENPDEPCGHDLYADPMSAVVTCPACGKRYDVTERKAWLMETARDHLASANEASALCYKLLGDLVTTAMIRGYVRRGRLAQHGARMDGSREVALYRIGDVIDAAQAARWDEREQRATRKAGAA